MCTHDWRKGERFQISRKDAHRQGSQYLDWFHARSTMECVPQWKVAGPWLDLVLTTKRAVLCAAGEAEGRKCLELGAQKDLQLSLPGSPLFLLEFAQLCVLSFPAVVARCKTGSQ